MNLYISDLSLLIVYLYVIKWAKSRHNRNLIGNNVIRSFMWGDACFVCFELVIWIRHADQHLLGLKVTTVWAVLYTLLHYTQNTTDLYFCPQNFANVTATLANVHQLLYHSWIAQGMIKSEINLIKASSTWKNVVLALSVRLGSLLQVQITPTQAHQTSRDSTERSGQ